ncbi:MAG: VWA domain-containing protein [Verrucomicrobia bacterium]|nr:VWA domain-containing protein [Verrucomicrobiota bacterium]
MTFAQPLWFTALLLIPLLYFCMSRGDAAVRRRLERLVAPRLRSRLVEEVSRTRRWLKRILLLMGLAGAVVALARPQWSYTERPVTRQGRDILIAVDTSRSMLSADISPDRLTRAKLAAEDIIRSSPTDRIGLIAFAGEAQLEAPLTADLTTLRSTLARFDTNTVERGGTDFEAAIRAGMQAFGKTEHGYRALVLITDGEELEGDGLVAAREAAKLGIRIFTVGVGTPEGANIVLPSGLPLRDRSGRVVLSRLDEEGLRAIAEATGGFYTRLEATAVRRLINEGLARITQHRGDERAFRVPVERFQIPLAVGLALLLASFLISNRRPPADSSITAALGRRKLPAAAPALALLMATLLVVMAATPLELYQRGDYQRAFEAFQDELQRRPDDPLLNYNAGDAGYRVGKYEQAFESYAKAMNSPDSTIRQHAYYNAGNTLFKQGDAQEDLEGRLTRYYDAQYQYEQALELDPSDAAARKNLEILKRRIKETEEQKKRQEQAQKNGAQRPGRKGQNGRQRSRPSPNGGQSLEPSAPSSPDDSDTDQGAGPDDPGDTQGDKPGPDSTPADKNGDVRERGEGDEQTPPTPNQGEEKPGRMSADEARGLLDSLRGDEDRVDLNHHKRDRAVTKDW